MLFFSYDGSVNGDWVSHYAVQLAAGHHRRQLNLIHARDGLVSETEFAVKVERLGGECERVGVELISHVVEVNRTIQEAILSMVPRGREHYLLCGTRVRERKQSYLRGTISESLLYSDHCNVLAIRVVQPGVLGLPRQLIVPVGEHRQEILEGLPFLRLFVPQVSRLHILLVVRISRWRLMRLSHGAIARLREPAVKYCGSIEQEISEQLGLDSQMIDTVVVVSDDFPREVVFVANKTKSRLIIMGASKQGPAKQFFRANSIEQVLRETTCDVAVYRGLA